jgi:large subunit ribosomal protein L3
MLGLMGKKIGMTKVFSDEGKAVPVTVIEVPTSKVTAVKTKEKHGYSSLAVGCGIRKANKVSKPVSGVYSKLKLDVPKKVQEFRLDDVSGYEVGSEISIDIFENIKYLDISGVSKGKGFQGVVKKYGMRGGPKTHGSHFHRRPGSIGQCADPSRVHKGKKMPGQMGNVKRTVQNIQLVSIDKENSLLVVKGSIPGANNTLLTIKPAVKKLHDSGKDSK